METNVCPKCGIPNDSGSKYCGNCGYDFQAPAQPSPGNNQPPQGSNVPPQGTYVPPQGGYQPPQGGYQPPQGGYQQSQGGYQQPQGGYQQPQGGGYYQQPPINPQQKSKLAGGLLGIFLGTFGVHNFYLGYMGKAIAQLLITVLSIGLLSWVSWIWGLIEGILILTGSINVDGKGMPLRD